MITVDYFKHRAKIFLKCWKNRDFSHWNIPAIIRFYNPVYFPDAMDDVKLCRAQHFIAKMSNFNKWDELAHASEAELEKAKECLEHSRLSLLNEVKQ